MVKATDDLTIKRGDRLPAFARTLTEVDGTTAVDLTGSTVRFRLSDTPGRAALVDAAAAIVDAPTGKVRYDWAAANTSRPPGRYYGEFVVTTAGGLVRTFPAGGHYMIRIEPATAA